MTQSDLRDLRPPTDARPGRTRSNRRLAAGAAIVAAVAVIAGMTAFALMNDDEPSSSSKTADPPFDPHASFLVGEPPTAEQVRGVWRVDNGTQLWLFQEDGTFRTTDSGHLYTAASVTGTWALAGDQLTLTATSTDRDGCIGDFFKLRTSISEPGRMNFVQTDVSTGGCSPVSPRQGVLEHLLPTETSTDLIFSTEPGWKPLTDRRTLPGFWLAEGGGYGLELNKDGEYVVADNAALPVDYGTWTYAEGELALTSHQSSPECDAGDRLVLSGVERVNLGTDGLRGNVSQNACAAAWTPPAWFLIPDAGS